MQLLFENNSEKRRFWRFLAILSAFDMRNLTYEVTVT